MTKFFAKKLNKKGFTLAELLIVIAIIAILVAIAVPIFTSELDKAKVVRDKANIRSGKAAAVAVILGDDKVDLGSKDGWKATISYDADTYDVTDVAVTAWTAASDAESNNKAGTVNYSENVVIHITGLDLSGKTVG